MLLSYWSICAALQLPGQVEWKRSGALLRYVWPEHVLKEYLTSRRLDNGQTMFYNNNIGIENWLLDVGFVRAALYK